MRPAPPAGGCSDLAALLPDFVIERGGADPTAAFAAGRRRRSGSGPRQGRGARWRRSCSSAKVCCALPIPPTPRRVAERDGAAAGRPPSPAALLDPEHVLATRRGRRGIARARRDGAPRVGRQPGRRKLVGCREGMPRGDGLALVCADRATPPGRLGQMLAAARAETSAESIVVLAAQPARLRDVLGRRMAALSSPTARSMGGDRARRAGVHRGWRDRISRAARGATGALLRRPFYAGWGITRDTAAVPQRPSSGPRRDLCRRLPGRHPLPRSLPRPPRRFEEIVAILADWRRISAANRESRCASACRAGSAAASPISCARTRPSGIPAPHRAAPSRRPPPRRRDRGLGLARTAGLAAAARRTVPVIRVEDGSSARSAWAPISCRPPRSWSTSRHLFRSAARERPRTLL